MCIPECCTNEKLTDHCIRQHNNERLNDVSSLQDCIDACDGDARFLCRSLDYSHDNCFFSTYNRLSEADSGCNGVTLYNRCLLDNPGNFNTNSSICN